MDYIAKVMQTETTRVWYLNHLDQSVMVPRDKMPQVDEADYPLLFDWLNSHGMAIRQREVEAEKILTHQAVDEALAVTMPAAIRHKPILASREPYVLDGNHRVAAQRLAAGPVRCWALDARFEHAIAALMLFPKTYCYGDGKPHPISY